MNTEQKVKTSLARQGSPLFVMEKLVTCKSQNNLKIYIFACVIEATDIIYKGFVRIEVLLKSIFRVYGSLIDRTGLVNTTIAAEWTESTRRTLILQEWIFNMDSSCKTL